MSLKYITSFMTIVVIGLLHACTEKPKEWKIGVSQCSEDIWRYKQNREMVTAAYTYNNVQIELASADDSDSLQISQIQAFIDQHVDLLVVSPNTKATKANAPTATVSASGTLIRKRFRRMMGAARITSMPRYCPPQKRRVLSVVSGWQSR